MSCPCFTDARDDCECQKVLSVPSNPAEVEKLHCIIIGAGPAGIEAAKVLAHYDHKVAIVESCHCGGQEIAYGSIAMTKMIDFANLRYKVSQSSDMGVDVDEVALDWGAAMVEVRKCRREASEEYALQPLIDEGLNVYHGEARFIDNRQVTIDCCCGSTVTLKFEHAIIATGATPHMPLIPGLEDFSVPPSAVFGWEQLPPRIAIVGGGLTGCQLANCLSKFGSRVFLIEKESALCREMDTVAQQSIRQGLQTGGVQLFLENEITSVSDADGAKRLRLTKGAVLVADAVVVCAGTTPKVQNLNLSAGRVEFSERGIKTQGHYFRTSNRRVYAVGDCREESFGLYTTAVDEARAAAEYIRTNAVTVITLDYPARVCWVHPTVAQVGRCKDELEKAKIAYDEVVADFRDGVMAQIQGVPGGFARIFLRRNTETVLGALIVHENASEMIAEFSILVNHELSLAHLANVAHSDAAMIAPIATVAARHAARLRSKTVKHKRRIESMHRAHLPETTEAL